MLVTSAVLVFKLHDMFHLTVHHNLKTPAISTMTSLNLAGVFGANLDGNDMTRDCSNPDCNILEPDTWVCFYSPVEWE